LSEDISTNKKQTKGIKMHFKTILNVVEKHQYFLYGTAKLKEINNQKRLEIPIKSKKRCRPSCSVCRKKCPQYDTLPSREFQFIPIWGILVFFLYSPRRVSCKKCGIKVEYIPWANGKSNLTKTYSWFLADWAKTINWKGIATHFKTVVVQNAI
jgi:transposase